MANNGLGIRQRRMLADLVVYGQGHWPIEWRVRHVDRETLESLYRRGLVTATDNFASLTPDGRKQAAFFAPRPPAWPVMERGGL